MDNAIRSYRNLKTWQRSKQIAIDIYKITDRFPRSELYGLTGQMRRAAVSMASNIAEGFRRNSGKEKLHFTSMAYGSGAELETQLEISSDLGYVDRGSYQVIAAELDECMRMLNAAIQKLKS